MRAMTTTPSAPDTRPWWPTTYRPVWKLLAVSAAVGIAGVILTIVAVFKIAESDSYSATPLVIFLVVGLLLWGTGVGGWAVKKGSSWPASLGAGLVAVFTVSAVWIVVLLILSVIVFIATGAPD
jgi:hypothetical protein